LITPETATAKVATSETQLVGLVYDKNDRPGDQATMSITNDPKKYENIPGLGVVRMSINVPREANGQVNLEAVAVDLGAGRPQTANQPLTLRIPSVVTEIPITLRSQGNPAPLVQANLPVPQGSAIPLLPNTGSPGDFTTPPVCKEMSFIRGPLTGDSNATRIMVDNQPATIIAESPRSVYFNLPAETLPGRHQLTVQDGTRSVSFPIVKMSISGHIDQPALQRGQKTNYSVTVNFGKLPQEFWQRGGGMSAELVNPLQIQQAAPGFHIPQAAEPGVVLLAISNASRDTVSITPSQNERVVIALHQQDFQNNQFTTRGEVQSKKSGSFVLDLLAEAFFAPIPGEQMPGELPAGGPTAPEPMSNPIVANSSTSRTFCEKGSCANRVDPNKGIWCLSSGCNQNGCACHLISYSDAKDKEGQDEGTPTKDDPFIPPKVVPPAKPRIYICSCVK
jgi:hypothetical protein